MVVNYAASSGPAEELVRAIESKGGRALAVKADVSDAVTVRDMFEATEKAFGGIDVLVNNAGIMKLAKVADCDDAAFDQQIAINLKGSFNGRRRGACATAVASSISPPASSAPSSRPTASIPRPRPRWRR